MANPKAELVRRLGPFDATMIVMGGIVGAGIFMNPYVVARQVHTPLLILGVWIVGGLIALAGSFVYAELSARRPEVGGQYAYLREAYHPAVAFVYGWSLLLVIQSGGMAAVAVTFAHYFLELVPVSASGPVVAVLVLASLTVVNCLGVRAGGTLQSTLMVMKILAIAALVACGLIFIPEPRSIIEGLSKDVLSIGFLPTLGAAMVPVLFAYGGWQTASFVAGEMVHPERNLPRGLLMGVAGVIVLYLGVNYVCLAALGAQGLAESATPASDVMRRALGNAGASWIALGIALSTLGFLSQSILTAPRVYYAMAEDRLFFQAVAWIHPRTHVPILAIVIQGLVAGVICLSGKYEQILNYVVSVDFIFFGLTGTCVFVLRRRDSAARHTGYKAWGHPLTTALFVAACWMVVIATIYRYPLDSAVGLVLVFAGIPVYFLWRARNRRYAAEAVASRR